MQGRNAIAGGKMHYTKAIDELCTETASTVGGKAYNLARLASILGISVPHGFCVKADAFREAVGKLGLPLRMEDVKDADAFSKDAKKRICDLVLPEQIELEIIERMLVYNPPFAVRSSATLEDSKDYSFAGQQDSFLRVAIPEVVGRVKQCWASLYNSNALSYRKDRGISEIGAMSVVVQEMVRADAGGVLFTAQQSRSNPDVMVINAAWGLCDSVVGGRVNPDAFYIRKSDGKVISIVASYKHIMSDYGENGVVDIDLSKDPKSGSLSLNESDVRELYRIGMMLEKRFGTFQDIEFCKQGGSIYLVQARPLKIRKKKA
jgi:phosphoenolpyruvate synthase/pyruvate phosphate dikinase